MLRELEFYTDFKSAGKITERKNTFKIITYIDTCSGAGDLQAKICCRQAEQFGKVLLKVYLELLILFGTFIIQ